MDDLKIGFRLENCYFSNFQEIESENQESIKKLFGSWERKIRHAAAIKSLDEELQFDSSTVVTVSVETKKESQTVNG